jgi:DNA polymerase III delta prime subunit
MSAMNAPTSSDPHQSINLKDSSSKGQISQAGGDSTQLQGKGTIYKDVTINHYNVQKVDTDVSLTRQEYLNRQALINKVRNAWIKGVLEQSLYKKARIELGLEEWFDVLDLTWITPEQQKQDLPKGTKVIDKFDDLGIGARTLLILGAPGSGKTITLLELTRDLLGRAEREPNQPIPVIFNLSSWIDPKQKIADWLVQELNTKYQVTKPLAKTWIQNQQLLLLLDGLDEVRQAHREACVVAINAFIQSYGQTEIVICSRIKDYEALSHRLRFQGALFIQPLTAQQIDYYLNQGGEGLAGVKTALQTDLVLQELVQTPLMLNVITLAYQGVPASALPQLSLDERRQHLFDQYIERMFKQRAVHQQYSPEQAKHWLSWLARQLVRSSQTIFLIEWIDRHWLQTTWQRSLYTILSSLLVGLAFGLVITPLSISFHHPWLFIGVMVWAIHSFINIVTTWAVITIEQMQTSPHQVFWQRLVGSLVSGLGTGSLFGMVAGIMVSPEVGWRVFWGTVLTVGLTDWWIGGVVAMSFLKPVEVLRWSWISVSKYVGFSLIGSIPLGLLLGGQGALGNSPVEGLLLVMLGSSIFGLLTGLRAGAEIETHTTPNQGIRRSLQTAAIAAAMLALGFAPAIHLLQQWIKVPWQFGVFYGLFVGLMMGGTAFVVHISLRIIFYFQNYMPWNYARFLDWATHSLFLQKVGGGYIFVHRLLMEHFAAMNHQRCSDRA